MINTTLLNELAELEYKKDLIQDILDNIDLYHMIDCNLSEHEIKNELEKMSINELIGITEDW